MRCVYCITLENALASEHFYLCYMVIIGMWLSLVECLNGVQEAAGSNPVIPTISSVHNVYEVMNTRFFVFKPF